MVTALLIWVQEGGAGRGAVEGGKEAIFKFVLSS